MKKEDKTQDKKPKMSKAEEEFIKKNERCRNFAFLVYPDSAPKDWLSLLQDEHIEGFAILHDRDVTPDGELKKPHYHVILMNKAMKSPKQWFEIRDRVGGVGYERVNSKRGYSRYLCHMDNPEKAQYTPSEIISFAGADYNQAIESSSDAMANARELRSIILEEGIVYLCDLYEFLDEIGRDDLIGYLDNKGIYPTVAFMKSVKAKANDLAREKMNYEMAHLSERNNDNEV